MIICLTNIGEFYSEKEVLMCPSLSCSSKYLNTSSFVLFVVNWGIQIGTFNFHLVGMGSVHFNQASELKR